ncbi:MAG: HAMP domain-containing histidine kinase, partial [Deltaproteobacteria bacterium]|nr:HAMP domain-containing histidine kinase [Deltaproteobacteria bacterium]
MDSSVSTILDLVISSSYLIFITPLYIFVFIAIHVSSIIIFQKKNSRLALIILGVSSSFIFIRSFIQNDYLSVIIYIPSLILVLVLLKAVIDKNNLQKKEAQYLKNLIDNKNRLLSTLTHELRTPLAVINTSSELILEERPGPLNETQKSLLSSSLENTKRLTSLVEKILSQVKVEFAWFSMKKKVIDIRPLIRTVATDIKPFLDTRRQTIHYNYPGLLSRASADSRWLQQVLLNLIHNSSKHSSEGSKLEITVKENEQCIVVSVHDQGMGIENREISHVFNEFYQSGNPL